MVEDFKADLERGKFHEIYVLNKIQKKYSQAYIVDGYFKEYDIFIPELNFGVEVKFDNRSVKTGNIIIETASNEKPSGISTTKAKYWVIYDGMQYNWILTDNIRKCISNHNCKERKFVCKGDTKTKQAYLIKYFLISKYTEKKHL
jgi:hypothetical protein|tara:strand:+ start:180 stop:614 length:435 start_codon:yes stop_codon:yes gene_type:complete